LEDWKKNRVGTWGVDSKKSRVKFNQAKKRGGVWMLGEKRRNNVKINGKRGAED